MNTLATFDSYFISTSLIPNIDTQPRLQEQTLQQHLITSATPIASQQRAQDSNNHEHADTNNVQEHLKSQSENLLHTFSPTLPTLQQHLQNPKTNLPFDNLITTPKDQANIRIYCNTSNSIYKATSWEQLKHTSKELQAFGVDIFGLAETNIVGHQASQLNQNYNSKILQIMHHLRLIEQQTVHVCVPTRRHAYCHCKRDHRIH
jgi:hypothetical protein